MRFPTSAPSGARRFGTFRSRSALFAAIVAGSAPLSHAANVSNTWIGAVSGIWTDSTKWSAGVSPNNGVDTYSVTIGAPGSAYSVTLNSGATINDLLISSPNATLVLSPGTLSVLGSMINVSAGTFQFNGGSLNGGSIGTTGSGTIIFTGTSFLANNALLVGDLNLNQNGGRVRLFSGGTWNGSAATLSANSNLIGFEHSTTLVGKTIHLGGAGATVSIDGSNTLTIGATSIVRGRGAAGAAQFAAGVSGIINNGRVSADIAAGTLTLNPLNLVNNGTIEAINGAALNMSGGSFANSGTIQANASIALLGQFNSSWSNAAAGLVSVSGGGTLTLDGAWSNAGVISTTNSTLKLDGTFTTGDVVPARLSRSGGTLNLTGTLVNTGTVLALGASTGDWVLNGGVISGGSITTSAGGSLLFSNNGGNRLANGAVISGDLTLGLPGARLRLQSGSSFSGSAANLTSSTNLLGIEQTVTLIGKTINMNGTGGQVSIEGSNTLTVGAASQIRGRGSIGPAAFFAGTSGIINDGRISADIAASILNLTPQNLINNGTLESLNGGSLNMNGASFSNSGTILASGSGLVAGQFNSTWSNTASGTLSVIGGGTMTLDGTWSNAGLLSATNSTLNLGGTFTTGDVVPARLSRSGGTLNLTGTLVNTGTVLALGASTGDWVLNGGVISGGSITTSAGGSLLFSNNGGNRLANGAVISGDLTLGLPGARLRLQSGGTWSDSAATLSAASNVLAIEHVTTMTGKTVNLDGTSPSLSLEGSNTLTIGATSHIRGRGTVGVAAFLGGISGIVNDGLVSADIVASTLNFSPQNLLNNGTIQAINGATLNLSSGSFNNAGTILANTATVVAGPFSGNWSNAASGLIGAVGGGTLTTDGTWSNAGVLSTTNSTLNLGGTFSGSSIVGPRVVRSGGTINITGFLNNTAMQLSLDSSAGEWRLLGGTISGGSIMTSGTGSLVIANHLSNRLINNGLLVGDLSLALPGARLRLGSGGTWSGSVATFGANANILSFEYSTLLANKTLHLNGTGAGIGIEGSNTLTIDSTSLVRGRGSFGAPVITAGTGLLINDGRVSADISLGQLNLNPTLLVNNGTLEALNGGTLLISTASASFTNNGTLRAASGGKLVADSLATNIGTLSADGTNTLARFNGTYTLNQPATVTNQATLMLLGNWTKSADMDASGRIVFDYPTAGPSPFAALRAEILSGYNSGAWNGPGIRSSAAAATTGTAVGYAESSDALSASGGSFSGVTVDGTAVLIRYTYQGDTNVDGRVDITDLGKLATNWQTSANWGGGDFDYSGFVDITDLGALATNWQAGVAAPAGLSIGDALAAVGLPVGGVPEPSVAGVVAAVALLAHRRGRGALGR